MNIGRRLFAILIIIFILTGLFNVSSVAKSNQVSNLVNKISVDDESDFDGYIVQFKEEPLLRFKNQLKTKIKNLFSILNEKATDIFLTQEIRNYKDKLITLHQNTKEDILKLIGKDASYGKIFSRDFINVFNGISIKNVPDELLNKIKSLTYVKDIFPNYRISVALDESVPLIKADEVWKMQDAYGWNITGKGVTIAIIDTGVDYNHPDLKDNYIEDGSYDFVNNDSYPMDDYKTYGHGTHCAGIACGKGNDSDFQYVGVAPDAKFYAFKILNESGSGNLENYTLAMEAAMDPNGDGNDSDHVDIVSLSLGTKLPGDPNDHWCDMANDLVDAGVVVVVAAGNLGPDPQTIASPGCAQKPICVGSIHKNKIIASSSSRGPVELNGQYIVKPDVVAPGVNVRSARIGGSYISNSGTSMATPHITGAAALILQANPDFSPAEVKSLLKGIAVDLGYEPNTQGSGMIDVLRALISDDILFIDAPDEIYEKQYFTVNITNRTRVPINAWVLFTVPLHLPRLKYGSSVTFKAPIIYRIFKKSLQGQIRVFRKISLSDIFGNSYDVKKDITLTNSN